MQVVVAKEEEMRLELAHFHTKKAEKAPSPKYVIPSFKKPPPLQEPVAITYTLPTPKIWPHEPSIPFTISLFEGGPVVWNLAGSNMSFWKSEEKKTKLPWEELQPIKEEKEVDVAKKEEDLILLFEEIPSFFEEEKDSKVVPFLEEQMMAFEPLKEDGDLLLEKEENNVLQKTILYDMEDEKESLEDISIFEEEHADMHKVSP